MRTIPEAMQTLFQDQQGLQNRFIVKINWDNDADIVYYSTCEYEDQEIYAYVKEFGEFESVSHVEGLGSVSSMRIVFYDQFGHFKEKMGVVDFTSIATATVYLTLDGIELFDLFEGKISDNAEWSNNEFTVEILSEALDKEVGYQPSIDDVDEEDERYEFLTRHLNETASWPSIFGTVKNYEIQPVWTQRKAVVEDRVFYDFNIDPPYYELKIDSHEDFLLDTDYFVNLVGRVQSIFSILGTGQFTNNDDGDPVFRLNKAGITSTWYQYIQFTVLDTAGISGETDQPTTRIEIAPGPFTIGVDEYDTLGPDGEITDSVWLQFMKLHIQYTQPVGEGIATITRHANCIQQDGNICTMNEYFEIPEDATNVFIRKVNKSNNVVYQIPSNTNIYIMGDRMAYVVDTKTDTTLDKISIKNGDELVTIGSGAYELKTDALWTGTHPPCLYIHMLAEIYMRYTEHYAASSAVNEGLLATAHNIYDTEAEAIEAITGITTIDTVPNTVNFAYLGVEDAASVVPEIAWQANKAVRFTRDNDEDVLELIDLTDTESPAVYTFNSDNILRGSLSYGFTSEDDLYTIFKADFQTNNLMKELETIKLKKNVDLYEEKVYDTDYYIFKSKTVAKEKLAWWRDKLSSYHYTIKLTGFMDAFGLEVWDRVYVEVDPSMFYDPADGTPFQYTHDADPQPIIGYGRIKEISPDLEKGLIDFTIEVE